MHQWIVLVTSCLPEVFMPRIRVSPKFYPTQIFFLPTLYLFIQPDAFFPPSILPNHWIKINLQQLPTSHNPQNVLLSTSRESLRPFIFLPSFLHSTTCISAIVVRSINPIPHQDRRLQSSWILSRAWNSWSRIDLSTAIMADKGLEDIEQSQIESNYDETVDSFDEMNLRPELLRGKGPYPLIVH